MVTPRTKGSSAAIARVVIFGLALALAATTAHAQPRWVAVLDFANTAKDPALEWLGPAVGETLTTTLRTVRALSLVERPASTR